MLLLAAVAGSALHAAEVRFDLVRSALIVIPVTVNDEAPVYFLLDTGADTTIVDTALAKKLGLATLRRIQQTVMTGSQTVGVSVLARLSVGNSSVEGVPVLEQDLSGLRLVDGRIVGILGQNFLSRFNYLLDYRARTLRVEEGDELRSAMEGDVAPVEVREHRMMVAAEAATGGSGKLRLLLDSGANALVLVGHAAAEVDCPMAHRSAMSSMAGMALVRTWRVDLTVAAHAFRDVPVSLMADAPLQPIGDGLLPMSLFDRVYVNNAAGYVVLNPRRKKVVDQVARR